MIEVLILSLIQGVTEFIPISSSSHLILISEYIKFDKQSLSIDVSLHIGSFLAIMFYFKKDILNFVVNKELFIKIFISSIPVLLIGYILTQTNFIEELRNIKIIAWTTLIFGILLFISDKFKLEKTIESNFSFRSALFIGFFQVVALIPGVSRSGIAITAARILNFKRIDAAKISFLLSVPILGGVSIYGVKNIITSPDISFSLLNLISILLSFVFSFITIKYFMKFLKKFSLSVFVVYRIILGFCLLIFSYLKY